MSFQRADLIADRRLAHAETVRRASEIAVRCRGHENLKLSESDGHGSLAGEIADLVATELAHPDFIADFHADGDALHDLTRSSVAHHADSQCIRIDARH